MVLCNAWRCARQIYILHYPGLKERLTRIDSYSDILRVGDGVCGRCLEEECSAGSWWRVCARDPNTRHQSLPPYQPRLARSLFSSSLPSPTSIKFLVCILYSSCSRRE